MNRVVVILMLLSIPAVAYPVTRTVCASGCDHSTIQSAVDASSSGDAIIVRPETFIGTNGTFKIYNKDNVTVQVSTPGSYFTIDCSSGLRDSKGCIYLDNSANTIIDGAKVINQSDEASAGSIRVDRAQGNMTVKNCWIKDGYNHGILAGKPSTSGSYDISIESCVIDNVGSSGGGQEHGFYIGAWNNLYARYNKITNVHTGHGMKTRAKNNYIEYNQVMDGASGQSTNSVDISCGGIVYAIGNIFQKNNLADSSDMFRVGRDCDTTCPVAAPSAGVCDTSTFPYWTEPTKVYVVNNTFIHQESVYGYGYIFRTAAVTGWPTGSEFISKNNIYSFDNTSSSWSLVVSGSRTPTQTNDILLKGTDPGFVNKAGYNYHLTSSATSLIDNGVAPGTSTGGYTLTPQWEYAETATKTARAIYGAAIDIGAYEYIGNSPAPTVTVTNPANGATGVPVGTTVIVTFSQDMDPTTMVPAAFNLTSGGGNVPFTVSNSVRQATLTPTSNLAYNTTYIATVTTLLKDVAGKSITSNFTWTFTTQQGASGVSGGGSGGGCTMSPTRNSDDQFPMGRVLALIVPVFVLATRKILRSRRAKRSETGRSTWCDARKFDLLCRS